MVLCRADKSSRVGPGPSVVPSRCATAAAPAPARKRKAADGVEHRPEAPTRARRRRQLLLTDDDDDDEGTVSFSETLEIELLRCFDTENSPAGGEPAAPERQDRPSAAAPLPCAAQKEEAGDDDDDVIEISLEEFLGSSAAGAAPPRTAQPESAAAMGASAPSERSGTPSALLTDDDDYDMCGLACPPMDEAYVQLILSEHIVQFDPTFIEEYISDL